MATFFTSDTHFGHANIIKYCKRPFESVDEMNEIIVRNWNWVVREGDEVYHLGDFCMGVGSGDEKVSYARKMRERLNGRIHFIMGNHDVSEYRGSGIFDSVHDYLEVEVEGQKIVLFHYGMRTWHHDLRGTWHLYGHSHGGLSPYGKSCDVGVDVLEFKPIGFHALDGWMAQRKIGDHPMFEEYNSEQKSMCVE